MTPKKVGDVWMDTRSCGLDDAFCAERSEGRITTRPSDDYVRGLAADLAHGSRMGAGAPFAPTPWASRNQCWHHQDSRKRVQK